MKLVFCAALALFVAAAVLFLAKRGERLGKRRAYLMALCSALFFSSAFAGSGSFFEKLERFWPSGLYAAEITPGVSRLVLPLTGTGELTVDVKNRGSLTWNSQGGDPVFLSWHILSENGGMIRFENLRVPFPHPVPPGDSAAMSARVSPASEGIPVGRYIIEFDLVREGTAWFADRGSAARRVPLEVTP